MFYTVKMLNWASIACRIWNVKVNIVWFRPVSSQSTREKSLPNKNLLKAITLKRQNNQAMSPKIRSPRKNSERQTKFRRFLALNLNGTSHFWGNIIAYRLLERYKGYEPSADRSANKQKQLVKTTFNQACYVTRWQLRPVYKVRKRSQNSNMDKRFKPKHYGRWTLFALDMCKRSFVCLGRNQSG